MHAVLGHLARRGLEVASQPEIQWKLPTREIVLPTWGIALLVTTLVLSSFALYATGYTFGRLIPTLVMVESPQAALYEPLDTIDADAPITKKPDPELLLVKQQPITSSIRSTIKHLDSKGGVRARFRGIALFVVYSTILSSFSSTLAAIPFVPRSVAFVLGTVLLSNFSLAWTHIVISDPSPKPWFRRLPAARVWKKVAGPTALLAIVEQLSIVLPELLSRIYGLHQISHEDALNLSGAEKRKVAFKGLSVIVLALILYCFIIIPTKVTVTRVQASLLADDQESIVPFDRSFGGKVIPEIVGGTGVVGLRDAWTTFDRNARVRLIKAYAKLFAIQTALVLLFLGVFAAEVFIVIGKSDLKEIIKDPKNGGKTLTFM